uniref:Peptidase S1 domain-containing protein n=1 Tax=Amphilophus citrinellus TaxID=61819 RepID=A0A3Q0QQN4_AMPCI
DLAHLKVLWGCAGNHSEGGSWPWHVTIELTGQFLCGGSLITDEWVLTAASCISNYTLNYAVVYVGHHIQLHINPNKVTRTVQSIWRHPEYNSSTHENDICLLKLSAPVTFTEYIQPICLASEKSTFHNGTSSWITGFGYESKDNSFPQVLQEVNVLIVGRNECQCYYKGDKVITKNMMCAGTNAGVCWDGGEPLMIKKGSVWIQSGVMTLHGFCGSTLKPEISTRVSQYQKWINNTVTGMRPAFVTVTSPGDGSDVTSTCSGGNLIHFTHFTSLCVPVVLLHVFVGSS